ncbi:hypothetical protein QAD02_004500 [Eretmocerus hayati]|uniref:Uncharacterized protein n=1 Tax=Eretmocerus hayati TaxID=131215 RepID=A0ACC2NPX2_9HYME|nr:hypothetical protein QAD02_004500 [Eretmocerus hayati]
MIWNLTRSFSILMVVLIQQSDCLDSGMNQIIQLLKKDESTSRVDMILKNENQLLMSPASSIIVKRITDEYSTTVTNYLEDQRSSKDQCISSSKTAQMISRQHNLRIGIVDFQDGSDSNRDELLSSMLNFIDHQNPLVRGKCMFIVISGNNSTYESFLRFGWMKEFLDLSVVEFVAVNDSKAMGLVVSQEYRYSISIHVFNPFYYLHSKNILETNATIFPDKLRNFNGYPLHVFMPERILSASHTVRTVQQELARSFFAVLNFKPVSPQLSRTKINSVHDLLSRKIVDFFLADEGLKYDDRGFGENECYTYLSRLEIRHLSQDRVVICQYQPSVIIISYSFVKTSIIFLGIVIIIWIASRTLQFDVKNWTALRIIRVLLGASDENRGPPSMSELVLKICLFAVSGLCAIYFNDNMMNAVLGHQQFLDVNSFRELSKSNLYLYMSHMTKDKLERSLPNDIAVQAILNRSQFVDFGRDLDASTIKSPYESQRAQLLSAVFNYGGMSTDKYRIYEEIDDKTCRMTIIDEPLSRIAHTVTANPTAFFSKRFSEIAMRLDETGMLYYWEKTNAEKTWLWRSRKVRYNDKFDPTNHDSAEQEIPLNIRLFYILIVSYSIAGMILMVEIIWKQFESKIRALSPLIHTILSGPL